MDSVVKRTRRRAFSLYGSPNLPRTTISRRWLVIRVFLRSLLRVVFKGLGVLWFTFPSSALARWSQIDRVTGIPEAEVAGLLELAISTAWAQNHFSSKIREQCKHLLKNLPDQYETSRNTVFRESQFGHSDKVSPVVSNGCSGLDSRICASDINCK